MRTGQTLKRWTQFIKRAHLVQEICWTANIWQLSLFTFVFFSVLILLPRCLFLAVARLWTLWSRASPCHIQQSCFHTNSGRGRGAVKVREEKLASDLWELLETALLWRVWYYKADHSHKLKTSCKGKKQEEVIQHQNSMIVIQLKPCESPKNPGKGLKVFILQK